MAKEGVLWRLVDVVKSPDFHETQHSSGVGEKKDSKRKNLGWMVLEALSSSRAIASQIVSSGVWLELLGVVVGYSRFTKTWSSRVGAAKTLSKMAWDPSAGTIVGTIIMNGTMILLLLSSNSPTTDHHLTRFLPQTLILKLKEGPELMLEAFDSSADTPELIWDGSMRAELRKVLSELLDTLLATKKALGGKTESYTIPPNTFVRYHNLEREIYIGGVYVSRFLKEPTFQLRDPSSFLEHLLQRWKKELETFTSPSAVIETSQSTAVAESHCDVLSSITTAIVYLCKTRDTLCDKFADWGYVPHMADSLNSLLHRKVVGLPLLSVVRLIHVAASRMVNVEALASCGQGDIKAGIVSVMKRAIYLEGLHEDSAFMIEALKKIYEIGLGDVDKCKTSVFTTMHDFQQPLRPSASPGDGPVRKRVDAWDDPLAMMGMSQPPTAPTGTSQGPTGNATTSKTNFMRAQYPMQANVTQQPSTTGFQYGSRPAQSVAGHVQVHASILTPPRTFHDQLPYQQQQPVSNNFIHQYQTPASHVYQPASSSFQQSNLQRTSSQHQVQPPQQFTATQHVHASKSYVSQQVHGSLDAQNQSQQAQSQHQYISGLHSTGSHVQQPTHPTNAHQPYGMQQPTHPPSVNQLYGVYSESPLTNGQHSQQHMQGGYASRNSGALYSSAQSRNYQPLSHEQNPQPKTFVGQPSPYPEFSQTNHIQQNEQSYNMPGQPIQGGVAYGSQAVTQNQLQPQPVMGPYQHVQQGIFQQAHPIRPAAIVSPSPFVAEDSISTISEPTMPSAFGGNVETVPEHTQAPVQQDRPTTVEGSGIDARTGEDPMIAAEQRAVSRTAAPGAAHGRVSLLQQALACELCEFLIYQVLENPDLLKIRDATGAKVHSIALLKLLTKDPGFGPKFKLILSGIPEWSKYKSQDHSLLITGHEQKADYFLTDGGGPEKKLLTG